MNENLTELAKQFDEGKGAYAKARIAQRALLVEFLKGLKVSKDGNELAFTVEEGDALDRSEFFHTDPEVSPHLGLDEWLYVQATEEGASSPLHIRLTLQVLRRDTKSLAVFGQPDRIGVHVFRNESGEVLHHPLHKDDDTTADNAAAQKWVDWTLLQTQDTTGVDLPLNDEKLKLLEEVVLDRVNKYFVYEAEKTA